MKKLIYSLFALLCLGSSMALQANEMTIRAKVPTEWTNSIHVYLYNAGDADGFHAASQDGEWWSYTYSGSNSQINAIFVNGDNWSVNSNQAVDLTVSSDACYQISYNNSGKCLCSSIACPGDPTFTFSAGTTIYYDFRAYNAGVNLFNSDWDNEWKEDVSSIIEKTLTNEWVLYPASPLFKSDASNNWTIVTCSTLPTDGQNMLVSTDGATYHWTTYSPSEPSVAFSGLSTSVNMGQTVQFAASSSNVADPTYTYYVKKGAEAYGSAVTSYKFNSAGTYTVKVEVRSNGVGDALASAELDLTCKQFSLMRNNHTSTDKGSEVTVCSSDDGVIFTATWNCVEAGAYYFYVTTNTSASAHANCDYLNNGQTFTDGTDIEAWLYGDATNCYGHSYTLNATRLGEYTFTLTLGERNYFKCDYPAALEAEVNLNALPEKAFVGDVFTLADYVASVNVSNPAYTFYMKKGDGAYGAAVTTYNFAETGTYTLKAEVRESGASGDALDVIEKNITIYEPITFYYINKDGWSSVYAYAYGEGGINNAVWPGDVMTATAETTAQNSYAVYSIRIAKDRFSTIIFNNGSGNQTADKSIDNSKPYYYNGYWYATLAECDLVVPYYIMGTMNDWGQDEDDTYTYNMELNPLADGEEYMISLDLTTTSYFKVVKAEGEDKDSWVWYPDGEGNAFGDHGELAAGPGNYTIYFRPNGGMEGWFAGYFIAVKNYPKYYIVGSMTDWEVNADYEMAFNSGATAEEYSYNMDLTTTSYFKVVKVDNNGKTWYPDGDRNAFGDNNELPEDGNYTIYFRPAGGMDGWFHGYYFAAKTPALLTYERPVTNGNYGTICLPYTAESVEGATLFSIAGKDESGIYLDEASELLMGVPYIFLANANELTVYYMDGQSFTPSDDHLYTANGLVGFINDGQEYTVAINDNNYILHDNGLYSVDSTVKIVSNRAYIDWSDVPSNMTPSSAPRRRIGVNKVPTGIEQVPSDKVQCTKVIENGVLYMMYNGTMYNVQGQIVK